MDIARTASPRAADHVDALPSGTRLGEFEITALLGVGGFGMVYQAFDHSLLRFVAIKEYMPAALAGRADGQSLWVRSSSDEQSFQAGLASFVSEARLLAQFDHPSLVKVFRFWEANRTAYMVMPLYSGMTLKQARMHMRTPPPEAWLRQLLWSVTSALRVLHEGQTLHRDVSPDNIFLQDNGPPVLLDLGAARRALRERDGHYTAVLKVNYAPIEQYADAASALRQGPWSDLYSLGAVVHGCLCNDAPLPATLRAVRDRMVPFARVARTVRKQFGVAYSPEFVQAISHCLALQPEDRPQSVDAFLQALQMTSAPPGLEHFDFRAALGEVWVEPAGPDAGGVAGATPIDLSRPSQPAPQPTQAQEPAAAAAPAADADAAGAFADTVVAEWSSTVMLEPAQAPTAPGAARAQAPDGAAAPAGRPPRAAAPAGTGPRRRRAWPWLLGGVAAAVLLGAGATAWWPQPQRPRYTPESEIITELAPQLASVADAPLQAAAASEAQPSAPPAPEPAAAPPAPAVPAAPARPRPARAAPEAAAPVPPAPAPAAPAPAAPPRPAAAAAPAPPPTPEQACASASFLARPLCIHQECQKAALASHPTCVAARRRQDEEARQRQLYPQ